jgi:hypothetical protein
MIMNKERLLKLAEVLERKSDGRKIRLPRNRVITFRLAAPPVVYRGSWCGCSAAVARAYKIIPENTGAADAFGFHFYGDNGIGNPIDRADNPTPKQVAKRIRAFVAEHA